MRRHYVYRTTHIPTGRWYVGIRSCACDPSADPYLGSGKALASLPKEELSKRVLVIVETREEAARIEAALVGTAEVADPMCLNRCLGGHRGSLGYRHTEEMKDKIGAHHSGKIVSQETRARLAASQMGRHPSTETRAKISAANRLRECSEETRQKRSQALRGRRFSEAHKAALRGPKRKNR